MATSGLDVVSIFGALNVLEKQSLGEGHNWRAKNRLQEVVLELYRKDRSFLTDFRGLVIKASNDFLTLNNFLRVNGFNPMFNYPLPGCGVVCLVDTLSEWLHPGSPCSIYNDEMEQTPAFEIPIVGFNSLCRVPGSDELRASFKTKDGKPFWYSETNTRPEAAENLVQMVLDGTDTEKYKNLQMPHIYPEVNINLSPDLFSLLGSDYLDSKGEYWHIQHSYQHFKVRMNRMGARAKVATGIAIRKGIGALKNTSKRDLDSVRIDWLSQAPPGLPFPFFYADYDSWTGVESLNDM